MPAPLFVEPLLGWRGNKPNFADTSSVISCRIAAHLLNSLGITTQVAHKGQTLGTMLEVAVSAHLRRTLPYRMSDRDVIVARNQLVSDFDQYSHLGTLRQLIADDRTATLKALLGTDYVVKPDVTVALDAKDGPPFLHAAVPCKWTLRSDRAQNVRHEAVILIRHRRGRLPHITPVTAEPLPSRIASLARGTAEVDAVYHVALDGLVDAVGAVGTPTQKTILSELMAHRRLRDVSDLAGTLQL